MPCLTKTETNLLVQSSILGPRSWAEVRKLFNLGSKRPSDHGHEVMPRSANTYLIFMNNTDTLRSLDVWEEYSPYDLVSSRCPHKRGLNFECASFWAVLGAMSLVTSRLTGKKWWNSTPTVTYASWQLRKVSHDYAIQNVGNAHVMSKVVRLIFLN